MQIIPIKDLRDTNKISNMAKEEKEPIYVTKNGYKDLVIMSVDSYEALIDYYDEYIGYLEGLIDMLQGNVIDGDKVMEELKNEFNI